MTATHLTSHAKEELRKTVRALRARLLDAVSDASRSEYLLDEPAAKPPTEARRLKRARLEAWLDEQMRGGNGKAREARARFLHQAVEEAAHTLLNRLVFVRILEHHGLMTPHVITGEWRSPGYASEFLQYAGPLAQDDAKGYRDLLGVVFDELALELPGLFGNV
ncbi:hypothetical protein BH09MYX1_BH09MYX1_57300 [soil metagenome]